MVKLTRTCILVVLLLLSVVYCDGRRQRYNLRRRIKNSPRISASYRVVPMRKNWKYWDRNSPITTYYDESEWLRKSTRRKDLAVNQPELFEGEVMSYIDPHDYDRLQKLFGSNYARRYLQHV